MKKVVFTLAICLSFGITTIFAQTAISASGHLGFAKPGGSGVTDEPEDLNLDGGLTYGLDVLYHINDKIAAGILFNRSGLVGSGVGDIDLFGLRIIGAKGIYTFMPDSDFTPFGGLTLGLSQLTTPEYSITDSNGETVTVEEQTGGTFAILPELGINFKGVFLSASYLIPGKYEIEEAFDGKKSMGLLSINIGYRHKFEF